MYIIKNHRIFSFYFYYVIAMILLIIVLDIDGRDVAL